MRRMAMFFVAGAVLSVVAATVLFWTLATALGAPDLLGNIARGVAFESYERAIDAHVKNIRHKLESDPARPRYLLTVYGVGYRFAELDE